MPMDTPKADGVPVGVDRPNPLVFREADHAAQAVISKVLKVLLDLVVLAVLADAALKAPVGRQGRVAQHNANLFQEWGANMAVRAIASLASIAHVDPEARVVQRAQAHRAGLESKGAAVPVSLGRALKQDRGRRLVVQRPKGMIGNLEAPLRMSRV